ncbi:MAG: acyltransferase [Chitinivibrionales bacterium]|nr:acyltransferase [Chitinivibrionales bacterium]MBD3356785.1 acyltransferase [Chitinivibrionales bacterium]
MTNARSTVKQLLALIAAMATSPLILATRVEELFGRGEVVFKICGQLLCLFPGIPGSYLRRGFYMGTLKRCSHDVHIDLGSLFAHRTTEVGARVVIGAFTLIGCARIGEDVLIGSRVSLISGRNTHKDGSGTIGHDTIYRSIEIGKRTWIGDGAIVMNDVGERCVVGAGSVVVKSAPSGHLAVGNPARFICKNTPENATVADSVTPES